MSILARVEEVRAVEHHRLRLALITAGQALEEVRRAEAERALERSRAAARKVDLFGNPIQTQSEVEYLGSTPRPVERRVDHEAITRRWEPVEDAVLARLDDWEMELWPLVRRWDDGEPVEDELRAAAERFAEGREKLRKRVADLRTEVLFVSDLGDPMRALFAAIDRCDRIEVEELLPALLSGDRQTADSVERSQRPEDISRNLREAAKRTPPPAPEGVAKSPLGQLLSWFGVDRS